MYMSDDTFSRVPAHTVLVFIRSASARPRTVNMVLKEHNTDFNKDYHETDTYLTHSWIQRSIDAHVWCYQKGQCQT